MTPTKVDVAPASAGINTVDVIAVQRQFLHLGTPLSGCPLTAANVNGDGGINTVDVIAIQRFFLGLSAGIAEVGKYQFNPSNRTYLEVVANQTDQDYDTLIFGDVASTFVERPEGVSPDVAEAVTTVATLALPEIVVDQSKGTFIASVKSSTIDARSEVVGFQGDLTFDERMVTFQSQPVQNAGLTAGNWTVSGNVLAGPGPIRTLRISAYSTDFKPLSGSGTLFDLKMVRVSKGAQNTSLFWAAAPNQFTFVDVNLKTQVPAHTPAGVVSWSDNKR